MATKKTFSISLDNNASMKPLYGGQYLNVFLQFDPSTSFERMKKATLHVCILNSAPTANSFALYDDGDITNLRDTSLNEVIDSYHYLIFDVTNLIISSTSSTHTCLIKNGYSLSNNSVDVFATLSHLEIEYEGPFDYLKAQRLDSYQLGHSFSYGVDLYSFNTYISKPLFDDALNIDTRLVYDFANPTSAIFSQFPKGWKLNVLEKITIDNSNNKITLIDERYNRRIFNQTNETTIYNDSIGSGFIIEKITENNTVWYKLFNPLRSAYKHFNSSGLLTQIVFENNDEISISYSQDEIEITDYRGVVLTITRDSNTLTTISTNVLSQTYNLNQNSNGFLTSLSFNPLSSNQTTIQDTFTYSNNRLTDIYSSDNYHLNINLLTKSVTFSDYFNNNLYNHMKYEYKFTNIEKTNLINSYSERFFFDKERNVSISGRNSGNVNNEDQIFHLNKTINFYSLRFEKEYATHLGFVSSNGGFTSTISNGAAPSLISTTTGIVEVEAGSSYLLIAKVKPILKTESTINHPSKSFFVTCPTVFGSNAIWATSSFDEEYLFCSFDVSQNYDVYFVFQTAQSNCQYEISNVYLIKMEGGHSSLAFRSAPFLEFDNNNPFNEIKDIYYLNNNDKCYLYSSDVLNNQVLRYKSGFVRFLFAENLTKLFVFEMNQSPQIHYNINESELFSSLVFAEVQWNTKASFTMSAVKTCSSSSYLCVATSKVVFGFSNPPDQYYEDLIYDYHGNLLDKIDARGVHETRNYTNRLSLSNVDTISSNNEYIYSSNTYDSSNRLIQSSTLVGDQVVNKSYQYSNQYLSFVSCITDENNNTTNYVYSTNFEYVRTIKRSASLFVDYFIHTELTDNYNLDKLQSPNGDYRFEYNSQRNELSKVYHHYNPDVFPITPSSIGGQDDPQFDPIVIDGYTTNLITITTHYYVDDGSFRQDIKYANNYLYYKEFDQYGRLIKINDSDTLCYQIYYVAPDYNANVSIIYDDSGYEDESISFTYDKGKVSSITYTSSYVLDFVYNYDVVDRLKEKTYKLSQNNSVLSGFSKIKTTYAYDNIDDSLISYNVDLFLTSVSLSNPYKTINSSITKDDFGRLTSLLTTIGSSSLGFSDITYYSMQDTRTCAQILNIQHALTSDVESFTYDNAGNILSASLNNDSVSYQYDNLYRLIREEHTSENYYLEYTYDSDGNIKSVKKKNLATNSIIESHTFNYDNHMPYKLSSFDGVSITYDNFLNPLSLNGFSLTYFRGNKLRTSNDGSITTTYDYFGSGLRSSKQTSSSLIRYFYENNKLLKEIRTSGHQTIKINYLYGINGIIGFTYDSDIYLYDKNVFNDVIAIYKVNFNNTLTIKAKYKYDAYGNHQVLNPNGTLNTSASFIGNINPFRYRSYYYDVETGFYYCQSRYYVPYLRRWLTMDSVSYLDNENMQGNNLFAYCCCNPVMYRDEKGRFAISLTVFGLIVGATIGAIIGGTIAYNIAMSEGLDGWDLIGKTCLGILGGAVIGGALGAIVGSVITSVTGIIGLSITPYSILPIHSITVLGTYPIYLTTAKELGLGAYNLPKFIFNNISDYAKWTNNIQYLADAYKLNSEFVIIADKVVTSSNMLWEEIQYLVEHGIPWEIL